MVFENVSKGMDSIPGWIAGLKVTAVAVERTQKVMSLPAPRSEGADVPHTAEEKEEKRSRAGTAVSLQHISFSYPESNFHMKDIMLSMQVGERVALVGESGSGKSTLLQMIAGLIHPDTVGLTSIIVLVLHSWQMALLTISLVLLSQLINTLFIKHHETNNRHLHE